MPRRSRIDSASFASSSEAKPVTAFACKVRPSSYSAPSERASRMLSSKCGAACSGARACTAASPSSRSSRAETHAELARAAHALECRRRQFDNVGVAALEDERLRTAGVCLDQVALRTELLELGARLVQIAVGLGEPPLLCRQTAEIDHHERLTGRELGSAIGA